MADGHGGARKGAGRRPGTHSMAPHYREFAKKLGVDPIEYMLTIVADPKQDDRMRLDAAKASAPYLAPKLKYAEVETTNFNGDPATITNEQLIQIILGRNGDA